MLKSLHDAFTIKDLGNLTYFLGIEVTRTSSGILLNQRKYILDLLQDSNLQDCQPVSIPFSRNLHLSNKDVPLKSDPEPYRRLVGKLLYLNMTRPDISYCVQQLSQFLNAPAISHFQAGMHVLKYLKGTINMGLFYPSKSELILKGYCDADWANCPLTAKFYLDMLYFWEILLLLGKPRSRKQLSKALVKQNIEL